MSFVRSILLGTSAALLLAACGSAAQKARECRTNADCAPDAHCGAEGACVASTPPVAAIVPTAGQMTWTGWKLDFQASAAIDPASGEHVREYRWSVEGELRDRCMEPEVLASGDAYSVVLWCPGEWDVKLVVVDSRGVAAPPVLHHLSLQDPPDGTQAYGPGVEPRDPPVLRLAVDRLQVQHRCARDEAKPSGWTCTLDVPDGSREVALVADAHDAQGGPVQVAWECAPPAALRATAHARLVNATKPTARLAVETDDARVVGDYRCIVQIWDARGQTKSAAQTVTVGNRAPVVSSTAAGTLRVPHRNDATSYRATVEPPAVTVSDPDGDPVAPAAFELRTARDGATPSASGSLEVVVPHADPAGLIGPTVHRTLVARSSDAQGATAELSWPVEITNQPPRRTAFDAGPRVPHRWDGTAYVASAEVARYVDPEGDPLGVEVVRGDTVCGMTFLSGVLRLDCRQPRDEATAIRKLVGTHAFRAPVRDAWGPPVDPATGAPLLDEVRVEVLNGRSATSSVSPIVLGTTPGKGPCCTWVYDRLSYDSYCTAWSLDLAAGWRDVVGYGVAPDPDGDPLSVTVQTSGAAQVSVAGSAPGMYAQLELTSFVPPLRLSLPAATGCGTPLPSGAATVTLDDGTGPITLPAFTIQP